MTINEAQLQHHKRPNNTTYETSSDLLLSKDQQRRLGKIRQEISKFSGDNCDLL